MDIIMTGHAAFLATAYLAELYFNDLCDSIPERILYRAQRFSLYKSDEAAGLIEKLPCEAFFRIGYGGVFKALWDMAEDMNTGIRIFLKDIPIKQETVEICNVLDVNPYMLDGNGSYLLLSENGNGVVRKLSEAGIPAAVIGYTSTDNDRVIINGDETRYLTFRVKDELDRLKGCQENI